MYIEAHLVVEKADEASVWYSEAFGAVETGRVPLPDGRTMAVTLKLGDHAIHVGSEFPSFGILRRSAGAATGVVLQINTSDAQALWTKALGAGARPLHELSDTFWGARHGQLSDPFGHRWNISQHLREVPAEEVASAAAKIFSAKPA